MRLIQDLVIQIKMLPKVAFLAVLLAIAYLFFKDNRTQIKNKLKELLRQRWLAAFIIYMAFILMTTLISRQNTTPYIRIFDSFGFRGDPKWDTEIIENILVFIPYSFIYIKAFAPSMPWKASLKLSTITSATIEICQLLFWLGSFQLADIVHNVFGGMIGCGIWYLVQWVKRICRKQNNTEIMSKEKSCDYEKLDDSI